MIKWFKNIGPGTMVAAAFIGPGTVTLCTLAGAYVTKNCFGWNGGLKDIKFRIAWFIILVLGVIFSSLQFSPIEIIKFAQIANGILLPIVALFLLWVVNKTTILGKYRNGLIQNIISIFIILITIILGFKSILKVFELL